ncbi:hypothetical protein [Actinomadura atramentaria]|uniref:hypothetical protein n=1 Tax=Actinomadura atramentaria TaxID=1990 RepID=UPI00039EDF1A|nr:hypothetical protein [Actinomadura atramentaria]
MGKKISGHISPDFDRYAAGEIPLENVRCALCHKSPCECPEFGTPEYFTMLDNAHKRK